MFKEGSAHPLLRIPGSLKACLYCGWGLNADLSKNLISCSHLTPLSVRQELGCDDVSLWCGKLHMQLSISEYFILKIGIQCSIP